MGVVTASHNGAPRRCRGRPWPWAPARAPWLVVPLPAPTTICAPPPHTHNPHAGTIKLWPEAELRRVGEEKRLPLQSEQSPREQVRGAAGWVG